MIKEIGSITVVNKSEFIGLSTDIKPLTCGAGSTFQELDGVKSFYIFDGTTWVQL